jgi:hypothetical protein
MCDGSLGVCAHAHTVVCWRRVLSSNQFTTIANGTFAGLTALRDLYVAGLWTLGLCSLLAA